MAKRKSTSGFESRLGHRFEDRALLVRALTHSSAKSAERPSNERLEFLGDAVLSVVVAADLFRRHPDLDEGKLTKVRAQCVSKDTLAEVASRLDLRSELIVGNMFADRRGITESILADAVEAVIAAVYLDGGFRAATPLVRRLMKETVDRVAAAPGRKDFKSQLGQWAQKNRGTNPIYKMESHTGPDHLRTFEVSVSLDGAELARGVGSSKKAAEQEAAAKALEQVSPA